MDMVARSLEHGVLTRLMKNNVVASCTLEEYETTITGEHLLSRTEGYGAEGALTTVYSYDDSGRLISSASPNAGEHKTVYDAAGRPVLENSPWGANGLRTVSTKYRDSACSILRRPAAKAFGAPASQVSVTLSCVTEEPAAVSRFSTRLTWFSSV